MEETTRGVCGDCNKVYDKYNGKSVETDGVLKFKVRKVNECPECGWTRGVYEGESHPLDVSGNT